MTEAFLSSVDALDTATCELLSLSSIVAIATESKQEKNTLWREIEYP